MKEQRRGKAISMTPEERNAFLREQRTCRVATVGRGGEPHVSALWFVWDEKALWLNSLSRSQRWTDIERDPRVSVIVDTGHDFGELRGVTIHGKAERVGEVPRKGEGNAELEEPERLFSRKYMGSDEFVYDGRHAWLRITPEKIVSWDFRKIPRSSA